MQLVPNVQLISSIQGKGNVKRDFQLNEINFSATTRFSVASKLDNQMFKALTNLSFPLYCLLKIMI